MPHVRRGELRRTGGLARTSGLRRTASPARGKPLAPAQPVRDWTDAIAKRDREGRCRVCGAASPLEAAHVIGREHDQPTRSRPALLVVLPDDVVPLCRDHHREYDARRLDLLPHLTHAEQAAAVRHVGIVAAYRRATGRREEPR